MDDKISRAWRDVYNTPQGKTAISALLMDMNLYSEIVPASEMQAGILIGERNIAARIARLVGRAPEDFVQDAIEDADLMERMLKTKSGDSFA